MTKRQPLCGFKNDIKTDEERNMRMILVNRPSKGLWCDNHKTTHLPTDFWWRKNSTDYHQCRQTQFEYSNDPVKWIRSKSTALKIYDRNNGFNTNDTALEEELHELIFNCDGKCELHGGKIDFVRGIGNNNIPMNSLSFDAIDPSKGHTFDNLQVLCNFCNNLKNIYSIEQIKVIIRDIYNILNYKEFIKQYWSKYMSKHDYSFNRAGFNKSNSIYVPSDESIIRLWRKNRCVYCSVMLSQINTKADHVIPTVSFKKINSKRRIKCNEMLKEYRTGGVKWTKTAIKALPHESIIDDLRFKVPCCTRCNSSKGAKPVLEFLKARKIEFNSMDRDSILVILRATKRAYPDTEVSQDWLDELEKL